MAAGDSPVTSWKRPWKSVVWKLDPRERIDPDDGPGAVGLEGGREDRGRTTLGRPDLEHPCGSGAAHEREEEEPLVEAHLSGRIEDHRRGVQAGITGGEPTDVVLSQHVLDATVHRGRERRATFG